MEKSVSLGVNNNLVSVADLCGHRVLGMSGSLTNYIMNGDASPSDEYKKTKKDVAPAKKEKKNYNFRNIMKWATVALGAVALGALIYKGKDGKFWTKIKEGAKNFSKKFKSQNAPKTNEAPAPKPKPQTVNPTSAPLKPVPSKAQTINTSPQGLTVDAFVPENSLKPSGADIRQTILDSLVYKNDYAAPILEPKLNDSNGGLISIPQVDVIQTQSSKPILLGPAKQPEIIDTELVKPVRTDSGTSGKILALPEGKPQKAISEKQQTKIKPQGILALPEGRGSNGISEKKKSAFFEGFVERFKEATEQDAHKTDALNNVVIHNSKTTASKDAPQALTLALPPANPNTNINLPLIQPPNNYEPRLKAVIPANRKPKHAIPKRRTVQKDSAAEYIIEKLKTPKKQTPEPIIPKVSESKIAQTSEPEFKLQDIIDEVKSWNELPDNPPYCSAEDYVPDYGKFSREEVIDSFKNVNGKKTSRRQSKLMDKYFEDLENYCYDFKDGDTFTVYDKGAGSRINHLYKVHFDDDGNMFFDVKPLSNNK